jgi:hypothetical protein
VDIGLVFSVGWIDGIVYFDVLQQEQASLAWAGDICVRNGQVCGLTTHAGVISRTALCNIVQKIAMEEAAVRQLLDSKLAS